MKEGRGEGGSCWGDELARHRIYEQMAHRRDNGSRRVTKVVILGWWYHLGLFAKFPSRGKEGRGTI